ncbi:glycosyltransferase family 4 protein [Sporosarcina pasteurii]|uniref:D-inositol-3-phosphate glycosyltransferase n=1 Tax=Sporosarcina pasteurii TaxID=1474 RepID=A0A380BDU8_SPOPA|nr:glycosyltransferase family 4 protein [Sporosarcina pasteurii]MDS9472214.1 glycosyltransferase family 4 protein [Sporosarcina pasteurii]QBQ06200.1 glycosyltransferase family 1 protein [Sporosarcina pasteurii]SUI99189.1 D-inositol-3-phosphate glycosyltransferase [Sporosarcina pasteurii]
MKKMLFISNITNRITNFSLPSIEASQTLGYEFHLAANCSGFTDDTSMYNVKIHHIDLVRNPFSLKNVKAYKQMLALLKEENFDFIHCNTPIGGLLGRLCGKKQGVPKIIYTAHGFHFYKGAPLLKNILYKTAEMWLAHYTDAIITINQEDFKAAQEFKLRDNGNVYYIPGVGIDNLLIKEAKSNRQEISNEIGINSDTVLIISVGELNDNKNNKVIIKALGKLQNPNLHYILCGEGEKKDELYNIAKKYNIEQNIHFLGYRTDVYQLLNSSDIFVMPSYREGLSRSIMEAMSAGLPCIVSNIRGNVDLVEEHENGYLCEPDDIDCFAKAIDILVTNNELRERMSANNMRKVEAFNIENVKKCILDTYSEVLSDIK